MKKLSIALSNLFLSVWCMQAAEKSFMLAIRENDVQQGYGSTQNLPIYKIICDKDIALIPLNRVYDSFQQLLLKKQQEIKQDLKECPLFWVALLPSDLQRRIITQVYDDELVADKFCTMPMLGAVWSYRVLSKQCETEPYIIGTKIFSAHELFRLSSKKRNRLIEINDAAISSGRYILKTNVPTFYEYQRDEIRQILPEDMHKNLTLTMHAAENKDNYIISWMFAVVPSTIGIGLGIAGICTADYDFIAIGTTTFFMGPAAGFMSWFLMRDTLKFIERDLEENEEV